MQTAALGGGERVAVLGQGTWRMGEDPLHRRSETDALRLGVELGLSLIDTAEMYGEGATEIFLGEALAGLRDKIFLVSKVYPQNADRGRLERACEASLKRLRTNWLDLYLLHWRGSVPLAETVEGMEALKAADKIRAWGVSNFDTTDMEELESAGGRACAVDQVLYNVTRRGSEFELLPALAQRGVAVMAYSPVEQGRLPKGGALKAVGDRHGVKPYQVALAWILRNTDVIAIPKAANIMHVRDNRVAADLRLTPDDLALIDADFPPPARKTGWRCSSRTLGPRWRSALRLTPSMVFVFCSLHGAAAWRMANTVAGPGSCRRALGRLSERASDLDVTSKGNVLTAVRSRRCRCAAGQALARPRPLWRRWKCGSAASAAHGASSSGSKRARSRRTRRSDAPSGASSDGGPPAALPGWLWNGERLVVDGSVDGLLARRVDLHGRCRNDECSRQVVIDLHGWSVIGYGRAQVQETKGL